MGDSPTGRSSRPSPFPLPLAAPAFVDLPDIVRTRCAFRAAARRVFASARNQPSSRRTLDFIVDLPGPLGRASRPSLPCGDGNASHRGRHLWRRIAQGHARVARQGALSPRCRKPMRWTMTRSYVRSTPTRTMPAGRSTTTSPTPRRRDEHRQAYPLSRDRNAREKNPAEATTLTFVVHNLVQSLPAGGLPLRWGSTHW